MRKSGPAFNYSQLIFGPIQDIFSNLLCRFHLKIFITKTGKQEESSNGGLYQIVILFSLFSMSFIYRGNARVFFGKKYKKILY